ncbi:MAG: hypothetical protein ACXV8O_11015, partial [Methylobacter sp.]
MHSMMVCKNRVCFILFCLLQRCVGWITDYCDLLYYGRKGWIEKIISLICPAAWWFRDGKLLSTHNFDDSPPQLRRLACRRIYPTVLRQAGLILVMLLSFFPASSALA